jgi:DNA-binding transcriptional regulator YiaG
MNIAAVLKAETSRVARKEIRNETRALKKSASQHRSDIAALKRRVAELEKIVKLFSKSAMKAAPSAEVSGKKPRFTAQGIAGQRKRLGLSAADFGALVGVSGQSIYHWEQGKSRPRESQMAAILAVRKLGKREANSRLAR